MKKVIESRHKKNLSSGFASRYGLNQPAQQQTSKRLEILDLESICIILSKQQTTTEVLICLHGMHRLICAFVVRI